MPSINSKNLLSFVTSDYQARRIQNVDPNRFTQTVLQISDQQSRDKYYEKGLEWIRTYVGSLQAKLNAVVEELNNIYDFFNPINKNNGCSILIFNDII